MKIKLDISWGLFLFFVYLLSLAFLLFAHYMKICADPALGGEELALAFRNVDCLKYRVQPDSYSTTFSSVLFYWIGSYLLPISVQSARTFKILFMSGLPVIMCLILKRIYHDISYRACLFCVILWLTMAPVTWFSIMSTENCLECFFGFLLLYQALSFSWCRPLWLIIIELLALSVLAVWTVHIYGSAIVLIIASYTWLAWQLITEKRIAVEKKLRLGACFALTCVLTICWMFWPLLFYSTDSLALFAGSRSVTSDWMLMMQSIKYCLSDIFGVPCSYLLGGDINAGALPLFRTGMPALFLLFLGYDAGKNERKMEVLTITVAGILSLIVCIMSTDNPGIRRMMPALTVVALLAGLGVDRILSERNGHSKNIYARPVVILISMMTIGNLLPLVSREYWWVSALLVVALGALVLRSIETLEPLQRRMMSLLVVLVLFVACVTFFESFLDVRRNFSQWLQRDFECFEGKDYVESVEMLCEQVQRGQIVLAGDDYSYDSIIMLKLICDRRGLEYHRPVYDGRWPSRIPSAPYVQKRSEGRNQMSE